MHISKYLKMKQILTLLVVISFVACNPDREDYEVKEPHVHETKGTEQSHEKKLMLNNGSKWQADSSTKMNVNKLKLVAEQYEKSDKSFEQLKVAGIELQKSTEELIRECRMKGKDHDALHLWLEPLLQEIKALNAASDEASAKEHFKRTYHQLKEFEEYFN